MYGLLSLLPSMLSVQVPSFMRFYLAHCLHYTLAHFFFFFSCISYVLYFLYRVEGIIIQHWYSSFLLQECFRLTTENLETVEAYLEMLYYLGQIRVKDKLEIKWECSASLLRLNIHIIPIKVCSFIFFHSISPVPFVSRLNIV